MTQTKAQSIKKRRGLLVVICAAIIIINLAVTVSVSVINYHKYREATMEVHSTFVEDASLMVESSMTGDQWLQVANKIDQWCYYEISDDELLAIPYTDWFQASVQQNQNLTDNLDLAAVSVFTVDEQELNDTDESTFVADETGLMMFLMDFYPSYQDSTTYEFGDVDLWWSDYSGYNDYRELFLEIINTKSAYLIEETLADGQVLLSNYHPIFVNDKLCAIVLVSEYIKDIDSFIDSFFVPTLLIGSGITVLLTALAIVFFWWRIVRPLRMMTEEAAQFVSDNAAISQKLAKIRTHDEIQQLAESFLQMEKDLQNYIHEVEKATAEKEHVRTELNVASRIQQDMLPCVFPPYPNRPEFSICASMDPAKEVGGDFYDFFFIDENHLALVIADVSGKGVPASLFMVITKTLIKTRAQAGGTPAEILNDVNLQLCDGNKENMFVTVWLAIIDIRTGDGIAANAGHEHPLRRDKGSNYMMVEYRHSPAVAVFDMTRFRQHEFHLQPGDRIFVYTDGLPEATNAHDELYGTERLLTFLNSIQDAPLEEILPMVTKNVADFVGEAPQFDDLTMLVFEYHGKEATEK